MLGVVVGNLLSRKSVNTLKADKLLPLDLRGAILKKQIF